MKAVTFTVTGSTFESGKPYIARITGTDRKYGLAREFLAANRTMRGSTIYREAITYTPGLYETVDITRKGPARTYRLVVPAPDGTDALLALHIRPDTAQEIAAKLPALPLPEYRDDRWQVRDADGRLMYPAS